MTESAEALADRLISEILAEEEARLLGPECAPEDHDVRRRQTYEMMSGPNEMIDPDWGTCTRCERTLNQKWTPTWVVYHGGGCKCRECRARRAQRS